MTNTHNFKSIVLALFSFLILIISCSRESSSTSSITSTLTASTATTSTSSTIAVATDSTGSDSVYIMQKCNSGYFRDSIAQSSLPDSVLSYIAYNYSGYTFEKGFVIKDSAGAIGGYVVIISFNGKPVGLLFDSSGNFVEVLEQRQGGDLEGEGWHQGGRYGDRGGINGDTLSLSALPASISLYMSSTYSQDTLVEAYQNIDGSILVISKNNGLYATLFTAAGIFVQRISLTPPIGSEQIVAKDSLSSNLLSYLTNTYPNYVFEYAISFTVNGSVQGYIVIIDANNTKYAVWFDASGNEVATKTLW